MTPVVIVIPGWSVAAAAACTVGVIGWRLFSSREKWDVVSAELSFANIGKVEIRPNHESVQIAHRAWVELATRKAGVPFDTEYDVVVEVYDSWYELFGRLRALARDCPAAKLRSDGDTRKLVFTLTSVLNHGMRPHLTRWQASFRRWYNAAIESASPDRSPQEVQREYPNYDELVSDLKEVQSGLQAYMRLLKQISTGQK